MRYFLHALWAISILAGCSSTMGRKISQQEWDAVTINKTAEAEVRAKFGAPNTYAEQSMTEWDFQNKKFDPACGKAGDSLKWLAYSRSESSMGGYSIEMRNIVINKNGVVCNKVVSMNQSAVN